MCLTSRLFLRVMEMVRKRERPRSALLCFSFSSQYHALYLLPLAVSAAAPRSAMRSRVAWLGLALAVSPHLFVLYRVSRAVGWGPSIGTVCTTIGLAVLLVAVSAKVLREQARQAPSA